jgi:hypothetical protein
LPVGEGDDSSKYLNDHDLGSEVVFDFFVGVGGATAGPPSFGKIIVIAKKERQQRARYPLRENAARLQSKGDHLHAGIIRPVRCMPDKFGAPPTTA